LILVGDIKTSTGSQLTQKQLILSFVESSSTLSAAVPHRKFQDLHIHRQGQWGKICFTRDEMLSDITELQNKIDSTKHAEYILQTEIKPQGRKPR
jgi:hypothetical protein